MVYTDGVHLVADNVWELHTFAKSIGLRRSWFQDGHIPHYDLTTKRKARQAIDVGAKKISVREIVMMSRLGT
uniref:DUF4031 domain-containing protein n=1 Tax=viral metagenome TaxID=1070528 RepID=A0A6M3JHH0_9ZZZZ